jgi:hypothetical protein
MSVGSRVTLSSGPFGSEVFGAGVVGAAAPVVVAGARVTRGVSAGAEVRTGGALVVVVGRAVVVAGAVDVGVGDVGGADDGVTEAVVVVSVGAAGFSASCERAVNHSARATTIARKPMLITVAATRPGGVGEVCDGAPSSGVVGSVISGSYDRSALPATREQTGW